MAERKSTNKLPIPRLTTEARRSKTTKRKDTPVEKKTKKKEFDRARDKTRINIGHAFERWRDLRDFKRFKLDSQLATFLLDSYEKTTLAPSRPAKALLTYSPNASGEEGVSEEGASEVKQEEEGASEIKQEEEWASEVKQEEEWASEVKQEEEWASEVKQEEEWASEVKQEEEWASEVKQEEEWASEVKQEEEWASEVKQAEEGGVVHVQILSEDQHLTEGTEVTTETNQAVSTDDSHMIRASEIVATIDEESDPVDETDETDESSDQDDKDSDDDWKPVHLCTDCGMLFNKQRPHNCEHKIKPYPCNICGKRFISELTLNIHSKIHNENYEHRCKYCHLTFETKVYKVTHEKIHKTQGKPYKCPECSETFASDKERKIHLEDHRGPRQLKCHICGIEFIQPKSLQRHLAVHTGVKLFKCSVCQRGFNQPSHLKSHMRLHTGERPYKCQHCDKHFNHNVSLKSHVEHYHTPNSGHEQKKGKKKQKTVINTDTDAQENGNERDTQSGLDDVREEHDKEEEVQEERIYRTKKGSRSTGRPIGRPKGYESGNLVEGQYSNNETGNLQTYSDEESEKSSEKSSKKAIKSTVSSRGRRKKSDCDPDFDPKDRKKIRYSSQRSGKSRGGPTKKS